MVHIHTRIHIPTSTTQILGNERGAGVGLDVAEEVAMKTVIAVALVVAGVALGGARVVGAHHSHSMFDMSREVTLTGTVTSVSFRNPHVFLYVDVKGEGGDVESWSVEMSNIPNMQSRGIFGGTFKVGDVVTVKLNPLKDGRFGGNYTSVVAADGKVYE
jgi:hypothetical protein